METRWSALSSPGESNQPPDRVDASDFVLDARADGFAVLAGRPTSLDGVVAASRARRARGEPTRWRIPLRPELVHRLEGLFSLARSEAVDPMLLSPERPLDPAERQFAWDFVRYRLLEEEAEQLTEARRAHYEALERLLAGSGTLEPARTETTAAELREVLRDGARGLAQWMLAQWTTRRPAGAAAGEAAGLLPNVTLIGAYGGDHIGDAAILGGVLRRIHERHQTSHALLMSQRPEHTRRLVAMLEVPVDLRVEAYEHAGIRESVAQSDAVVFAGGPLTDIPKQLVRHLYAASLARRLGKPFLIEGVGVGPFPRLPSAMVARRLARMAQRISVRTSDDARQPAVSDLAPEVGRDPAFDYLESRGQTLTRLPEADRASIDALLAGTEGRLLVGLNTRPIGALFTQGTPKALDRAEHTRRVETRFEEQLADAITRFDGSSPQKPCFVFYPMNAIQFGQPDLRSAFRIQQRVGKTVDLRVWQGNPSIDGAVSLLRRLDLVIAMRFHGTIFALSQGRRVIGIDYRPGQKDKVGYLLGDLHQSENCTRIDELESDWLLERLVALAAQEAS